MRAGVTFRCLLLVGLMVCGRSLARPDLAPGIAALRELDGFAVSAMVEGAEIGMLVTERELRVAMREALLQAGLFIDEQDDLDSGGGWLHLVVAAYAVEPVFPEDENRPLRLYPISVYLAAGRPMANPTRRDGPPVPAQVWWTHVEAWALESAVREVTCLAVRKALGRFVQIHTGAPPARPVPHEAGAAGTAALARTQGHSIGSLP